MDTPPLLTDRTALARNRARAQLGTPDWFLHERVASEVEERLSEVNRTFTAPAVITPVPELWRARLPGATIVSDDDVLALETGAHDLVIHALALHWASDPVGQLVQARHALKPDGLFLGALFGGRSLQELRACLAEAETRVTGGLSPRVVPMGEIRDLGALLQRAGFALPVADSDIAEVTYATPLHLMRDLRAMGEGNAMAARLRRPTRRAVLMEAMRLYAEHHARPDGRIPATLELVYLSGWAPHPDQAQPLRPGSAAMRLADALGTTETPVGEHAAPKLN